MSAKRLLVLALFLLLPVSVAAQSSTSRPYPHSARTMSKAVPPAPMEPKQILQRESPGIVLVTSVDASGKPIALGSGFVVRADGIVVTNFHVVQGAADAQIKLKDGEIYDSALVQDFDVRRDVVILKYRAMNLPIVTLAQATTPVETGDRAYAIGNPEGLDYTISDGLISAQRVMEGTQMFQISVPISHGSSGGPLYNVYGQVIGITAAGMVGEGAENLNFAVPIKYVLPMLDSPPRNLTVAQVTQMVPAREETAESGGSSAPAAAPAPAPTPAPAPAAAPTAATTWSDPEGWVDLPVPAGWQVASTPPEGAMVEIAKGDACTLAVIRSDAKNADAVFDRLRSTGEQQWGTLNHYSDKVKVDKDNRHARIQTFQIASDNSLLLLGGLQNDRRVMALLGLCADKDDYDAMIDSVTNISW